jgi:glucose-1-phosphate cytidylyltransferase
LDTGLKTFTGGRIKRAKDFIGVDDFLLTYGDGLSDVDIAKTVEFHHSHGKNITMTAVQPAGRYGALDIKADNSISSFEEKPKGDGAWINGGFFVCKPEVLNYIADDLTMFEQEPLIDLAAEDQLMSFKHSGFWGSMDTLRDKTNLCQLWDSNQAPWKMWK